MNIIRSTFALVLIAISDPAVAHTAYACMPTVGVGVDVIDPRAPAVVSRDTDANRTDIAAVRHRVDTTSDWVVQPVLDTKTICRSKTRFHDETPLAIVAEKRVEPFVAGLAPVASDLDVAKYLQPSWGTGAVATSGVPEDVGAFRFSCAPSHNAYDDPIIYPGQPGKSHLHTFFGNTRTDANSTYASLRTSGDSTCNNVLNRSAYWIAAMMNGQGQVVMPEHINVYYKQIPAGDPRCRTIGKACVPLPRGLRYVFGYNMQNPAKSSIAAARWWNCDAPNSGGHFATIADAARNCPVGALIGGVLFSPDCWDGKQLDSADHRSHVAYGYGDGYGKPHCPATHPYIIPQFTIGAWYTVDATVKDWYLSSDRMNGMAPMAPGSTLHSDWFGAWEDSIAETWWSNCINKLLNCSGGDLGNGQQMTNLARYTGPRLVDPPGTPILMAHRP